MPAKPKKPDPCCFVVFGVTGDLAHRLVIPALYNLAESGLLPQQFCIVGVICQARPCSDSLSRQVLEADTKRQLGLIPREVVEIELAGASLSLAGHL